MLKQLLSMAGVLFAKKYISDRSTEFPHLKIKVSTFVSQTGGVKRQIKAKGKNNFSALRADNFAGLLPDTEL